MTLEDLIPNIDAEEVPASLQNKITHAARLRMRLAEDEAFLNEYEKKIREEAKMFREIHPIAKIIDAK